MAKVSSKLVDDISLSDFVTRGVGCNRTVIFDERLIDIFAYKGNEGLLPLVSEIFLFVFSKKRIGRYWHSVQHSR